MDKKSSNQKPGFPLPSSLLQKGGSNYAKLVEPSAETDKQHKSLEQVRNTKSSRLRASYLRNFHTDQQKMHHSLTTNPFQSQCEESASNLSADMNDLSMRHTSVVTEERKVVRSMEVKLQANLTPVLNLNIGTIPLDAGDVVDSPVNHKQHFIINHCQLRSSEPLNVYVPVIKATYEDHRNLIRKFDIGESNMYAPEKLIMMVGATGSGKSTLINGLFNYIFDIKWEDDFRLKLIEENVLNQADSVTKYISSYTIHHQEGFKVDHTITVIDTPGFGDTQGIKRDQEITKQIKTFFTTAGPNGIDKLDAVAFVANSSLARLTLSQKYIFESILAIFGKDIASCIILLLTFADGQKPQILDSIKEANFPHRKHFKFNSSALYINNKDGSDDDNDDEEDAAMGKMFWDIGERSFKSFVAELDNMMPTSLVQTKEVLDERRNLEISVEGIQKEIKLGLGKLERLTTEVKVLSSHEQDIDEGKVISYEVMEVKCIKKDIPRGQNTTNCLMCSMTCHRRCTRTNDAGKIKCCVMTNGYCRICPEKCSWNTHRNQPYVFVYKYVKKVNTIQSLKTRYEEATGVKLASEQVAKECANDFEAAQMELLSLAEAVRKSIQRLEEIALRPNPLSTVEYIDILIQSEKQEGKLFWQERVHQLHEVRKKAVYVQQVMERKLDPFKEYREKVVEERRETEKGCGAELQNIWNEALASSSKIQLTHNKLRSDWNK